MKLETEVKLSAQAEFLLGQFKDLGKDEFLDWLKKRGFEVGGSSVIEFLEEKKGVKNG